MTRSEAARQAEACITAAWLDGPMQHLASQAVAALEREGRLVGASQAGELVRLEALAVELETRPTRAEVLAEAGWAPCSPEWLATHPTECGTAPRLPGDGDVSHWHPLTAGAEIERLSAELGKDTREHVASGFTPASIGAHTGFVSCIAGGCPNGEYADKAAERGWEATPSGWLCPQSAAEGVGSGAAGRAADELQGFGTPETVATELTGEGVRLFLRVSTRAEWTTWMERLGCDQGLATSHGNGLVTSHGIWRGVPVAVRADGVPALPKPGENRG